VDLNCFNFSGKLGATYFATSGPGNATLGPGNATLGPGNATLGPDGHGKGAQNGRRDLRLHVISRKIVFQTALFLIILVDFDPRLSFFWGRFRVPFPESSFGVSFWSGIGSGVRSGFTYRCFVDSVAQRFPTV